MMEALKMIGVAVLALVVAGLVMAAGLKSISSFSDTLTTGSAEKNATVKTIEGISQIGNQMPTIGIIIAMTVILLLIGGVAAYFGLR